MIELIRGVPLVSVLFMASVMFPLFLPEGVTVDKLLRAILGIALFTAAYLEEALRAGLAASSERVVRRGGRPRVQLLAAGSGSSFCPRHSRPRSRR